MYWIAIGLLLEGCCNSIELAVYWDVLDCYWEAIGLPFGLLLECYWVAIESGVCSNMLYCYSIAIGLLLVCYWNAIEMPLNVACIGISWIVLECIGLLLGCC